MYFVRIPYKESYRENFHSTINFLKYTKYDKKYIEKTDIQWITFDTIITSLDNDNINIINYPLRKVFRKTFEDNLINIKNFCSNFII